MEILNKTTAYTREDTYVLEHSKEGVIIYKEWLDDKGKVVDSVVRSKSGHDIEDPILIQEIWEFIDQLENSK